MNRNARGRLTLALIFAASAMVSNGDFGLGKRVHRLLDHARLRIIELSLAGWNTLISAELAALAVLGLHAKL